MARKWNIGILGCGMIVRRGHLPGLMAGGNVSVPVIYGPDTPNSHEVAASFGIPRFVHAIDRVFETPGLDAVVVALPNYQHGPAAMAAIAAGLPILLEKPIASDIGTARSIVAAAGASGVRVAMSLPQRQRPSLVRLKSLIDSGALGRIESIGVRTIRRAGVPGYGGWFTRRATAGGGVLMDLGPHVIDAALWLAGCSEAENVHGRLWSTHGPAGRGLGDWGSRGSRGRADKAVFDVEDRAWLAMDLKSGAHVTAEVAWAVYGGDENLIRIVGERGGAEYAPERHGPAAPLRLFRDGADGRPADSADPLPVDHDPLEPAWAKVAQTFVEDLAHERSRLVGAAEALIAAEVIDQVYADRRAAGAG